ncbi:MAG: DAK2 domain-containing protein [Chloroflexi bacterium]|nr:DAK2 domain-containing protein [Chloroflexota bacterium]
MTPSSPPPDDGQAIVNPRRSTGADLRAALLAATVWLEHHAAAVNALNVFPVPDGDTGTNMALTMRAAVKDLEDEAMLASGAGDIAARIEYGALMGARGNSGVILSQLLRGFSRTLDGLIEFDGLQVAEAFRNAATMGYRAVIKPVEGTMLTVAREAAEAGITAAAECNDITVVTAAVLAEARASLARTPDHLEILRQAGVVDAGGMGLVVLLEGIHRYQTGQTTAPAAAVATPVIDLVAIHAHHPDDFGYCTNFVIRGQAMPYDAIRAHFAATGHSVAVAGDERLIKVHLHTLDPGAALSYATGHGALTQIKVDNMDDQRAAFEGQAVVPAAIAAPAVGTTALLAVAAGDGFARILTSLGVRQVIAGGQTMNPSAAEILAAIEASPEPEAIVLPNNGNIIMAARQAADLATKPVRVVPSRSLPQGMAALLAFRPGAPLVDNATVMTAAMVGVHTGEVTGAVRSVTLDGVAVRAGDTIALLDDRLIAATVSVDEALLALLAAMDAAAAELIAVYCGQSVTASQRARVRDLIAVEYPQQTLELLDGGQPHYDFVISVE